jgi:hypothetical protein
MFFAEAKKDFLPRRRRGAEREEQDDRRDRISKIQHPESSI